MVLASRLPFRAVRQPPCPSSRAAASLGAIAEPWAPPEVPRLLTRTRGLESPLGIPAAIRKARFRRPVRCSLPLRARVDAGGRRACFPFSRRYGIVHPPCDCNAFLRSGRLPGARCCRFPAAQMLTPSVMYTFLVGFQRTPGFLCASSLASCVASRGLGRPHETRAKALRAFDAG